MICMPYFFIERYAYNLIYTGEEVAISLGINVKTTETSIWYFNHAYHFNSNFICWNNRFVGIIAPHISRLLIGDDYRYLILLSGFIGAILVVSSDYIGRNLFSPIIIPIGIIISFIGLQYLFI